MRNQYIKLVEETLKGGLSDDKTLQDIVNDHKKKGVKTTLEFLKDQLKKGMKVESEHTTDVKAQKEIAQDHLSENPNYYIDLEKMEKDSEKKLKK